ncbi:MAG: ATP/GTP-binding protein [Clostridiaceae bacterium]
MFKAKNFSSFKDDIVLDLRKTSIKQHPDHTFKCGDFELLKTTAIYGANASGKSNLIRGMWAFKHFMMSQFLDKKSDINIENEKNYRHVKMEPFLLSNPVDTAIEFEIVFSNDDYLFQYGYVTNNNIIEEEWMSVNNEIVFERAKENKIDFGDKYKDILKEYNKLREDRLYLAILDYFIADNTFQNILDSFKDYFNNKFNIYFELFIESSVKETIGGIRYYKKLIEDECFRKKVLDYIKKIDVGISDFYIEDETLLNIENNSKQENPPIIKTVHNVYDNNGNVIDKKYFDLSQESSGTLRFMSFIQDILSMMEIGGVFIIDELSARLHPFLTKFIVDMFQSTINKNNTQLVFTTHEISIMNKDQFRRDEVVLIDKNKQGISSLYSLFDLGVKQDASFDKDYFKGKYGAIPIISYSFARDCD